jgi:hypothetical protein
MDPAGSSGDVTAGSEVPHHLIARFYFEGRRGETFKSKTTCRGPKRQAWNHLQLAISGCRSSAFYQDCRLYTMEGEGRYGVDPGQGERKEEEKL